MTENLLIQKFLSGRNPKTRKVYENTLCQFSEFLSSKYSGEVNTLQVTKEMVQEYIDYMNQPIHIVHNVPKAYEKSTQIKILRVLMAYYKYLQLHEIIDINPVHMVQIPRQDIGFVDSQRILRLDELDRLLQTARQSGLRDYAIVMLLVTSRFMPLELYNLQWGDFFTDSEGRLGAHVVSKRGLRRMIPIREDVLDILLQYRKEMGKSAEIDYIAEAECYVFINRYGERLSETGLRKMIYSLCRKADINKKISPKDLAHLTVPLARLSGATDDKLLEQTGFSNRNVLQKYNYAVSYLIDPACDRIQLDELKKVQKNKSKE